MSITGTIVAFVRTYSTGVIAATVSVGFAGYMLITGGPGGGGGLPVVQVAVRHVPVHSPLKEAPEYAIAPRNRITGQPLPALNDQLITGSIDVAKTRPAKQTEKPAPVRPPEEPRKPPRYVLRFAAERMALVEGAGRLWRVEPGDILPGAGRVLDIRQRKRGQWVVRTFDGRRYRDIGAR